MVVACARIFDLVSVPFTFVCGVVNVVDAMDMVGEVGVRGATYDLRVGWDDCVGSGVDVCMFEQVNPAHTLSE